jgi:hypothetical protein
VSVTATVATRRRQGQAWQVMIVATRKKKPEADASELARGYSVIVEEMRGAVPRVRREAHGGRVGRVEVAILETRHEVTKKVDRDEVQGIAEGVLARKSRR